MKTKRGAIRNKVLLIMVIVGFAILAAAFLHAQNLLEYEGSLDENISFELPEGFEPLDASAEDPDDQYYVRETADKRETIEIYYNGLDGQEASWFSEDETIPIDDETEVMVARYDWDHDSDNQLQFLIVRDGYETYTVTYQCRETDKENSYASCSKAQEEEMISFIKTFDYHRPDGKDLSIIQRLYRNYGVAGCVLLALTVLVFVGFPIAIGIGSLLGSGRKNADDGKSSEDDAVITSRDLHESMNREREAKGEASLPSINNVQGISSNNLARRDHSWNSVPDFFIKLFRRK